MAGLLAASVFATHPVVAVREPLDSVGVVADDALADVAATASSNPLLAAVGVLSVTGGAFALLFLLGWVRRTRAERLLGVFANREAVTILMHPNPDPDAMGCAVAVARLAEHAGGTATIQYPGHIRHQENRAFRNVLDLDVDRISSVDDLADGAVVLVDHNQPRGFEGAEDVDPVAVVDHHPGRGTGSSFTDVRPEYGATASIIAEYYRDLNATLLSDDQYARGGLTLPPPLATGLVYGILSDTKYLTDGCVIADFDAARYLYAGVDTTLLTRIANPRVGAETLEVKARAITERDERPPYAVSDVGSVGNVDAIPQAADELSGLETVTAVVVMGDDGEAVHLSGRSQDDRIHMGETIETVVEALPNEGGGGGHARMGGGQVALAGGCDRVTLRERLFDAMSENPSDAMNEVTPP